MASLSTPAPPVVGNVNHHSIELIWEDALKKAYDEVGRKSPIHVTIQESDYRMEWATVYTGASKKYRLENLEPKTEYRYRIRFQRRADNLFSDWSAHTVISTTREPLYGRDIHKSVNLENAEDLEKILQTGEVSVDVPDPLGFTPLMQAAKKEFLPAMELLIKYGADVNYKNESGKTALMMVCAAGKLESAKVLRKYNARYDLFDNGGNASAHWAVDSNNVKLIDWIVEDGADLNMLDQGKGKWTPLIRCACLHGNRDIALSLMMGGANMEMTDADGSTALHHAVLRKHYDLVKLLLQRRANPFALNKEKNSPYNIALALDDRRQMVDLMEPFAEKFRKENKLNLPPRSTRPSLELPDSPSTPHTVRSTHII